MGEGETKAVEGAEAPVSEVVPVESAPVAVVTAAEAVEGAASTASPPTMESPPTPASPQPASPQEDAASEIVDVEPVSERAKSAARGQHLPPPPPSIRTKSLAPVPVRDRLAVVGNPKLARDLMTKKLFTIAPGDVIAHLEEHMERFHFRHLPVVEDRKLVGLISHEDLLRVAPSLFSAKAQLQGEIIQQLPAKHIMQKELVTCRPDESLEQVAVLMWDAKGGCVLVTEEDATLVGIITEGDFIRLAHHFLTHPNGTA
jgi:CBS domain-containing protein